MAMTPYLMTLIQLMATVDPKTASEALNLSSNWLFCKYLHRYSRAIKYRELLPLNQVWATSK